MGVRLTASEIAARLHVTPEAIRGILTADRIAAAGTEPREVHRLHDVRSRPVRVYDYEMVCRAVARRRPPAGIDQRALAAALGKSLSAVRVWTRQGMPHRALGRYRRYDVDACRRWLAARPDRRQHRGRALNGGTVNVPLAVGMELATRDQLRAVADRLDVSISTLLREGARRVLGALGEHVEPPERLPHLRDDHPFRQIQERR